MRVLVMILFSLLLIGETSAVIPRLLRMKLPTPTPTPTPIPTPTPPPGTIPTGVSYFISSNTIDLAALNNPSVDGMVVQDEWKYLNPSQGGYNFVGDVNGLRDDGGWAIDKQIAAVEAAGKWYRISISTGGPFASGDGPGTSKGHKPDWLRTAIASDGYTGDKLFTYKDTPTTTATIPVPWEPTLKSAHFDMVQALADHLALTGPHPLLRGILVPYCNAKTNDFSVGSSSDAVDGLPPTGSSPQSRWIAAVVNSGFSTFAEAVIDTGNDTFDAYHAAFPALFYAIISDRLQNYTMNPGAQSVFGNNVTWDVINRAAGIATSDSIVAQRNNLNGCAVPHADMCPQSNGWYDLKVSTVPVAAQMVWKAYGDDQCLGDPGQPYRGFRMCSSGGPCTDSTQLVKQAYDTGKTYNLRYVETYEADILNLSINNMDPDPNWTYFDVIAYGKSLFSPLGDKDFAKGVYSWDTDGGPLVEGNPLLDNPNVDGIRLKVYWDDIQTGPITYNWGPIETSIQTAAAHGKEIILSVTGGKHSPIFIYTDAGGTCTKFTFGVNSPEDSVMPLMYETACQPYFKNFIRQLALRYDNNPVVQEVVITGLQQYSTEYYVVKMQDDIDEFNTVAVSKGFADKSAALRAATIAMMDTWMDAWHHTPLLFTLALPWGGGINLSVSEADRDFALAHWQTLSATRNGTITEQQHATLPPHTETGGILTYPHGQEAVDSFADRLGIGIYPDPEPDPLPDGSQVMDDYLRASFGDEVQFAIVFQEDLTPPGNQAALATGRTLILTNSP